MAEPQAVVPVKLFVAVLWAPPQLPLEAVEQLSRQWGKIDIEGTDHPFDMTDYYAEEMGSGLKRRLVSFARLVKPDTLVDAKLLCNAFERRLAAGRRRRVNLDIGYLDHNKIVLASVKSAGQKIYLGAGVYADLVARFRGGRYQPFEWTFPDFRDGRYDQELGQFRSRYLQQLRGG